MLSNTRIWRWEQNRPTYQQAFYTFASLGQEALAMSTVGVFMADSVDESSDDASGWTHPEQDLSRLIVGCFREVPSVRSICARLGDGGEMTVWTLLDSYNRDAREMVYERELALCQGLRVYNFDFRVTSFDLVSSSELVDGGFREVYKRP